MFQLYSVLHVLGQVIFGGYFIMSGINHFKDHAALTGYAASYKIPSPGLAVYVSGALLLLGGLGILFGMYVQVALWLLVIFLIPTTFIMHAYWKQTDPHARMSNRINFFKNLGLLGAVLLLMHSF